MIVTCAVKSFEWLLNPNKLYINALYLLYWSLDFECLFSTAKFLLPGMTSACPVEEKFDESWFADFMDENEGFVPEVKSKKPRWE